MGNLTSKLRKATPAQLAQALGNFNWNLFFAQASLDDLETFHDIVDKVQDALREHTTNKCKLLEVLSNEVQLICNDKASDLPDERFRQCITVAAKYVVKILPRVHISKRLKTTVRRILGSGSQFTRNLGWADQWDTFMAECREKLTELGQPLKTFFLQQQLLQKLGTYEPPLAGGGVSGSSSTATATTTAPVGNESVLQLIPQQQCGPVQFSNDDYIGSLGRECVYLHFLSMLAMALNDAFQSSVEEKLSKAGVSHTFYRSAVKSYERMYTKMLSREDHGQLPPPRAANNVDVVRCLVMFETADDMLRGFDAVPHVFAGSVYSKFKNGMGLSEAEAEESFNLRLVLGTGKFEYDGRRTMGELRSDPHVKTLWEKYLCSSAVPSFVTPKTWHAQATKAREWLDTLAADTPVFVHGEVQMVLRRYKETRHRMHELYKVVRAVDVKALDQDFRRYSESFQAAERHRKAGDSELNVACRDGIAAALPRLLVGADAHSAGRALEIAARYGRRECVLVLVSTAPRIGLKLASHAPDALLAVAEGDGRRAPEVNVLPLATLKGTWFEHEDNERCAIATVLLDGGMDVNYANAQWTKTALYWAAFRGFSNLVQLLIARNADVNLAMTKDSLKTPLHEAAIGHGDIIRLLVEAKADLHKPARLGCPPLDAAAIRGQVEPVQTLIECGVDLAQTRTNGTSALFVAAENGYAAVVRVLLDAKAPVDQRAHNTCSPLGIACLNGHAEVAGMLVDAKADVNNVFISRSAVDIATNANKLDVVEELLKRRLEK